MSSERINVEIIGNKKRKIIVEENGKIYDRIFASYDKSGICLFCCETKGNVCLLEECAPLFEEIFKKPINSCLSCQSVKSLMNIRNLLKKKKQWAFLCRSCCWEAEEKANEKIREEDWGKFLRRKERCSE